VLINGRIYFNLVMLIQTPISSNEKKKITFTIVALISVFIINAQEIEWQNTIGGSSW
jgi:hypothetical protein